MAWSRDDFIYSHLFIAAPELIWEDEIIDYLVNKGLISNEALEFIARLKRDKARLDRIRRRIKGRPLMARILAIAPEIISVPMVDLLSRAKLINKTDAHLLRLGIRAGGIVFKGKPSDSADVLRRARRLFGLGYSEEAIALLRSIDAISVEEANKLRSVILTGGVSIETLRKLRMAKTWVDMLALVGSGLIDKRAIDAMRLSGMLDARTANALLNALAYGKAQWTVWEGSRRAEGLAARMAYVASGSFSFEALEFLKSAGLVSEDQEKYLLAAVQVSQIYNRELMEQFTERRYRVVSGEAPIATYARSMKDTDDALLKLLAEAAEQARKESERLHGVRAAQYAINARQLHIAMRQVWEGVGYLTIFGEHRVADAAIQSTEMLQGMLRQHLPEGSRLMLETQARAGLDSYISRKENTLELSRRVYGNMNIWTGKVDKAINLAILQGKSAKEIGDSVKHMINPRVPGGMKYAAMRLGRTELANSFHMTTIRHTREMPWVQGYKWNKSSSHRHGDICDEYAEDDHDGIGPGVFKKANVPGKPHPQCMCYITAVQPSQADFIKNYKRGFYDQYLASMNREAGVGDIVKEAVITKAATFAGRTAGKIAMTKGIGALDRMMEGERPGLKPNLSINPTRLSKPSPTRSSSFVPNSIVVSPAPSLAESAVRSRSASKFAQKMNTRNEVGSAGLIRKSETDLLDRRRSFVSLQRRADTFDGDFDEYNYKVNIGLDDNLGLNPSARIYGTTAYRSINGKLRQFGKNLKGYDESFGQLDGFFEEAAALDRNSWHYNDDFDDLLMKYGPGLSEDELDYFQSIVNNYIQGVIPKTYTKHSDIVRSLDSIMRQTKDDVFTYRVTGNNWFGLERSPTKSDIGTIFKENAYTSTEGVQKYFLGEDAANLGIDIRKRPNRVQVMVPKGSWATRINDFENEILLSRGSKFQIIDVVEEVAGPFANTVKVMLISQDKLPSLPKAVGGIIDSPSDDELWDAIFGNGDF